MLRMFFFCKCLFVDFSPFFGKPFSGWLFESLGRHLRRGLPEIGRFARFVEPEEFCGRQAQGVEHHLGRDARYSAPPHPFVAVVVLQDAERPLDLYASVDPGPFLFADSAEVFVQIGLLPRSYEVDGFRPVEIDEVAAAFGMGGR